MMLRQGLDRISDLDVFLVAVLTPGVVGVDGRVPTHIRLR
jgi:hypothetical protein